MKVAIRTHGPRHRGPAAAASEAGRTAADVATSLLSAHGERRTLGEQIVGGVAIDLDRRSMQRQLRASAARAQQRQRQPREEAPRRRHTVAVKVAREAGLSERAGRAEHRVVFPDPVCPYARSVHE